MNAALLHQQRFTAVDVEGGADINNLIKWCDVMNLPNLNKCFCWFFC